MPAAVPRPVELGEDGGPVEVAVSAEVGDETGGDERVEALTERGEQF